MYGYRQGRYGYYSYYNPLNQKTSAHVKRMPIKNPKNIALFAKLLPGDPIKLSNQTFYFVSFEKNVLEYDLNPIQDICLAGPDLGPLLKKARSGQKFELPNGVVIKYLKHYQKNGRIKLLYDTVDTVNKKKKEHKPGGCKRDYRGNLVSCDEPIKVACDREVAKFEQVCRALNEAKGDERLGSFSLSELEIKQLCDSYRKDYAKRWRFIDEPDQAVRYYYRVLIDLPCTEHLSKQNADPKQMAMPRLVKA